MTNSKTLAIEFNLIQSNSPKRTSRSNLFSQLSVARMQHRQKRQSILSNILSAQKQRNNAYSRRSQQIEQTAATNMQARRKFTVSSNFNIHEDRKLVLSGKSSELASRRLTTRDVVRLFQREDRIHELTKFDSYEQVAFKHILDLGKERKSYIDQFFSTVGLSASSKPMIESPDKQSKPQTANPQFHQRVELCRSNSTSYRQKRPFMLNSQMSANFEERLYKYKQFLLLVNISNRIYRNLQLQIGKPLKYSIDRGNNSNLVRTIMARRFWWEQSDRNPIFVWSQLKSSKLHARQNPVIKSYGEMVFPARQPVTSQLGYINRASHAIREISKNMALKLLSEEDWNYLSTELDGQRVKFSIKARKLQKWIRMVELPYKDCTMTNHLQCNGLLGNKKAMFLSLKIYYRLTKQDIWKYLPETYHIKDIDDPQFHRFCESFNKHNSKVWIIKPGEFTNRGNGITIKQSLQEITKVINKEVGPGVNAKDRTFIVQHYLHQPLLYHRRKFDIRAYMMITSSNGILKGYWYEQGYIRTAGYQFSLDQLGNTYKHLTNDAIQKHSQNYGKYQKGNKLSYTEFQRYLESNNSKQSFVRDVYPVMKKIATDSIRATSLFLDPTKLQNNFEIFGLDFMIDSKFKTYLIEINTNPCLETGCPILDRVIPNMLENAFRIAVDPVFPPPNNFPKSKRHYISENAIFHNNFELVYDQLTDSQGISELFRSNQQARADIEAMSMVEQDETVYNNDPPTDKIDSTAI